VPVHRSDAYFSEPADLVVCLLQRTYLPRAYFSVPVFTIRIVCLLQRTYFPRAYFSVPVFFVSALCSGCFIPVSSADAARHLRGRRAAGQTLMVKPIGPTPGIRQVSATTRATSSALHTGTASTTCSKPVGVARFGVSDHHSFELIFYETISDIKSDASATVVDAEKADMKTKTHFSLTQTSKPKWLPATPFGISDHPHS
jgi:hypothetical protein